MTNTNNIHFLALELPLVGEFPSLDQLASSGLPGLLLALAVAVAVVQRLMRGGRRVRRTGAKIHGGSSAVASPKNAAEANAQLLISQALGDVRRPLARHARLRRHIVAFRETADGHWLALQHVLGNRVVADAKDRVSSISRATGLLLSIIAFLGDLAVVTLAIFAQETDLPIMFAVLSAFAIAVAIMTSAKVMAKVFRRANPDITKKVAKVVIIAGTAILLLSSVSLFLLQSGQKIAWLGLALAPAVASASVTLLGPSDAEMSSLRDVPRVWFRRFRYHLSVMRLRWPEGRTAALSARIRVTLQQAGLDANAGMAALGEVGEYDKVIDEIIAKNGLVSLSADDHTNPFKNLPHEATSVDDAASDPDDAKDNDGEEAIDLAEDAPRPSVEPMRPMSSMNGATPEVVR